MLNYRKLKSPPMKDQINLGTEVESVVELSQMVLGLKIKKSTGMDDPKQFLVTFFRPIYSHNGGRCNCCGIYYLT